MAFLYCLLLIPSAVDDCPISAFKLTKDGADATGTHAFVDFEKKGMETK
jgi:hypothetical protein